jgi:hypothetical protein
VALYGLLCAAKFEFPFIPALIYAFATDSVHYGHEARSYALVTLWITLAALCAYLATEFSTQNLRRVGAYSIAAGLLCGAAFDTHYFALFPASVILTWLLAHLRSGFRLIAVAAVMVACSGAGLGLLTLLDQIKTHGNQASGYLRGYKGVLGDVVMIAKMNVNLLWKPSAQIFTGTLSSLARGFIYGLWIVLLGFGLLLLFRHSLGGRSRFWLLVLGLALAPSAGLMLLDFLLRRHLENTRYLACAGPALAVIAAFGVAKLISYRPKLGWCLLVGVLLSQSMGINWGKEQDSHMSSSLRSLAKTIQASPASSRVVVIEEDKEGWYPAALIYELDPDIAVVTLGAHQDLSRVDGLIEKYDHIWFVPYRDLGTNGPIGAEFFSRVLRSGLYAQVSSYPAYPDCLAVLLRRAD